MQQLTLDWNSPAHDAADAPAAPAAVSDEAKAEQEAAQALPLVSATCPDAKGVADTATATTAPPTDMTPAAPLPASQTHDGIANATDGESSGPKVATTNPIVVTAAWQHPQANRHIVLGRYALGYWLQRRKRRSVGMKVASQGLEVHAPIWVNLAEIERILHSKSGWIVRKLQEQAYLQHSQQLARPQWQDGLYLPWRGGLLQLRLAGAATPTAAARLSAARMQKLAQAARLLELSASDFDAAHLSQSALASDAGTATAVIARYQLWLDLPFNSSESLIRDCTACWMQMQAQAVFTERMTHYAPMLGVQWRALKLSQANTRWGSASSNGTIRLHWRLMQMPPEVLDYVVVHELAHLREMNHSARFWALVEQILPDYRQRQFQLKRTTLPPW